jgi:hypothetical protein
MKAEQLPLNHLDQIVAHVSLDTNMIYTNEGSIWILRRFTYLGDEISFRHYILSVSSILVTRFSSVDALYD